MQKKAPFFHPLFPKASTAAILLAAGTAERFGQLLPKQFQQLGDKKVYQHALDTLILSGLFTHIIVVTHENYLHLIEGQDALHKIVGGETRQASSYQGILKAQELGADIVLIHDAARPFVSQQILKENLLGALSYGAVDTCIPSHDTLVHSRSGKTIDDIPKRAHMLRGQTPQTFQLPLILKAHENSSLETPTDDCSLVVALGHKVHIVQGSEENFKITTPLDLMLAEQVYQLSISRQNKSQRLPEKTRG